MSYGATEAAPVIPAAESALRSHPCVALSSAQVFPEWINRNPAVDDFSLNGANPLNFVYQPRGSVQLEDGLPSDFDAEAVAQIIFTSLQGLYRAAV
jgi:hypothetical protein